jgi:hypothetical protein
VIKFSTYVSFIFKISLKTVTNTQSNVTGYVNNICDVSHLKSGDKLFEFHNIFSFVGVISG